MTLRSQVLDLRIDQSDGDLYVGPHGPELVDDTELVATTQLILIAVRMFLEEWFLNLDIGMPWHQEILGKKYDEQLLRLRLSQTILGVINVVELLTLEVSHDATSRSVSVFARVRTAFGDTEVETEI